MTTKTTNQLPPCPLPDCAGGERHYHGVYAVNEAHDCSAVARVVYRCYGPHQPQSPQWQPIEHDQIRAGMRIRASSAFRDCTVTHMGVAHHADEDSDWSTEGDMILTGWSLSPISYEVDPATIPDPDADLIELIGKAIYDADGSTCEWGEDGTEDVYRKLARAALAVIRESEATA